MQYYPQYSPKQKWIHWVSAVITIIVSLILFVKLPASYFFDGMSHVYSLHKSLGVVIFILTIWRIYVVIEDKIPDVLPKNKKLPRVLSKSVQGLIYILLFILPLSGYLMSSNPLNVFGIVSIPSIYMPNTYYTFFHTLHKCGSHILILLLMLHIVGALYHYIWLKDKVLQSMLKNS